MNEDLRKLKSEPFQTTRPRPSNTNDSTVNFYGRDFWLNSDVLIPRPETEMIVDAVFNLAGKAYLPGVKPAPRVLPENPRILDVGTGSGCIAISLKLGLSEAVIVASDISKKALAVAKKNAEELDAKIEFKESDLLKKIFGDFDLVVANLPYVDPNWDWIDKVALAQEPAIALYAKDGGLELIKKLLSQANQRQVPYLILEADPCQHEQIIAHADKLNYRLRETRGFVLVFEYSH